MGGRPRLLRLRGSSGVFSRASHSSRGRSRRCRLPANSSLDRPCVRRSLSPGESYPAYAQHHARGPDDSSVLHDLNHLCFAIHHPSPYGTGSTIRQWCDRRRCAELTCSNRLRSASPDLRAPRRSRPAFWTAGAHAGRCSARRIALYGTVSCTEVVCCSGEPFARVVVAVTTSE